MLRDLLSDLVRGNYTELLRAVEVIRAFRVHESLECQQRLVLLLQARDLLHDALQGQSLSVGRFDVLVSILSAGPLREQFRQNHSKLQRTELFLDELLLLFQVELHLREG